MMDERLGYGWAHGKAFHRLKDFAFLLSLCCSCLRCTHEQVWTANLSLTDVALSTGLRCFLKALIRWWQKKKNGTDLAKFVRFCFGKASVLRSYSYWQTGGRCVRVSFKLMLMIRSVSVSAWQLWPHWYVIQHNSLLKFVQLGSPDL